MSSPSLRALMSSTTLARASQRHSGRGRLPLLPLLPLPLPLHNPCVSFFPYAVNRVSIASFSNAAVDAVDSIASTPASLSSSSSSLSSSRSFAHKTDTTFQSSVDQQQPREHQYIWFFRYGDVKNPNRFKSELQHLWKRLHALGRVYVAREGINAQMSVPTDTYEEFKRETEEMARRHGLMSKDASPIVFNEGSKFSTNDSNFPFNKLIVKTREKVVGDDISDDLQLNIMKANSFALTPDEWHKALLDRKENEESKDVVLIDVRNHWESQVGTFEGAIRLPIERFAESTKAIEELLSDLKYKESNNNATIMMFCTGGIRCEKLSVYLNDKLSVPQDKIKLLRGGINNYQNYVNKTGTPSLYKGSNIQFDNRATAARGGQANNRPSETKPPRPILAARPSTSETTLSKTISASSSSLLIPVSHCDHCGVECETLRNCSNPTCDLLAPMCDKCAETHLGACSDVCYEFMALPEDQRQKLIPIVNKLSEHAGSLKTIRSTEFYRKTYGNELKTEITPLKLQNYLDRYSTKPSASIESIFTQCKSEHPNLPWRMIAGPYEGQLLGMLAKMKGAKRVLEIGTFVGYSTLCFAEAVPADGAVITCENSAERAGIASANIQKHPDGKKVTIMKGNALETLKSLQQLVMDEGDRHKFDIVFIDADKANYIHYYNALLEQGALLLNKDACILVDNVLWRGEVLDAADNNGAASNKTKIIHEFNELVANDPRTTKLILPIRDGLTLIQLAR